MDYYCCHLHLRTHGLCYFVFLDCFILIYTVSQKNIPDIFDCNLKTNYQILIIFGTNISETTRHQMTI